MTDHSHSPETREDPSLERLLFFSDGVFAIAITLLSIELHPPHGWNGTVADLWGRGWQGFIAYGLSFLVIGIFWNAHRRIFIQINRFTQGIFLLNLLLLGAIALMPFATNLLYSQRGASEAYLAYLGLVSQRAFFKDCFGLGCLRQSSHDPADPSRAPCVGGSGSRASAGVDIKRIADGLWHSGWECSSLAADPAGRAGGVGHWFQGLGRAAVR
ncbi:MAG: DUF1211 domain-containing protein [Brevundimonas sp.]|nr:MAG: DUF1211 domain-containing protein [Brevundimonas sp.]